MMIDEGWVGICKKLFGNLRRPEHVHFLGTNADVVDADWDDVFREDLLISQTLVELTCNAVAGEIDDNRQFSEGLPMAFGAVLRPDSFRRLGERWKKLWRAVRALEAEDSGRAWAQSFLQAMRWPRQPWCREVFIGLQECDWLSVPHVVVEEISGVLTGMLSTKPVEDTLNRLRHSERVHKA